jgi:hypothetical protein
VTVVVEFKEFGQPVNVLFGLAGSSAVDGWRCDEAELTVLDALDRLPWGSRPADTPAAVRAAGALLREKLAAVPALKKALIDAFAAGAGAPRPLYFRLGVDPGVEALPFEALWDDHIETFACLEPTWPIARIPADAREPVGPFVMERAVRMVAVVAAEGVDPAGQVAALRRACASRPGLPVELTVLTTSPAVIADVTAAGVPGLSAEPVPATAEALVDRLFSMRPHLVHLFCHGTADGPRLLVGQLDDLGVLDVSAAHFDLAQFGHLAPWLVTLSCCESAAPGEQTVSLASGLVRAGLPAVLGMRKPVDARMADAFCADLYEAVFARLAQIAPGGRTVATLDWASLLHQPRRRLCTVHGAPGDVAGRQKEWTMPVLYVASPTLRLRGRPTAALDDEAVTRELVTVAAADGLEARGNMPADLADRLRAVALDRLYPGSSGP